MENENVDKLARMIMADSKLEIKNPLFTETVMNQVASEYYKQKNMKQLRISILVFICIEFILFAFVWMLLNYYPGYEYFGKIMNDIMPSLQKTGDMVIKNGYLIISFIVAYGLHQILNLKSKSSALIS
jgi:heme/copper-type cytochrome/quinol oxidase subunit 3